MTNDSFRDGELVIFRHPPELASYEIIIDIPGRADSVTFRTPNGVHRFDLVISAARDGTMAQVLKVHGRPGPDGALQVIVEEVATGETRITKVEPQSHLNDFRSVR